MQVRVDNLWATLTLYEDRDLQFLDEYLSFESDQARFSPAVQAGHWDGRYRLFDQRNRRFPAGLLSLVTRTAQARGLQVEQRDVRQAVQPFPGWEKVAGLWLRPYQREALAACVRGVRGIVKAPTGAGKCLGRGTPVLMADGTVVAVQDVKMGDRLMGPDGTPRRVLSTTTGEGQTFRIDPVKGEPWICNDVHVLTLVNTSTGEILDIPLDQYLKKSKWWRHLHKLVRRGVERFERQNRSEKDVDPYFLGVWLGDGRSDLAQGVCVSTADPEIAAAFAIEAGRWGVTVATDDEPTRCLSFRMTTNWERRNGILKRLRELFGNGGTCAGKSIPDAFKLGDRQTRLALLAGLIDTDGALSRGGFDYISKSRRLADDVAFVSRSLGLAAYVAPCVKASQNGTRGTYFRVSISGDCSVVPTRLKRKQAAPRRQKKDHLRTGFTVESVGVREYFGFTLDGDGRFLLGDFTVTHNTEIMAGLAQAVPDRWIMLVHTRDLMHQAAERIEKRTGEACGLAGDGEWRPARVTCCTFQTLARSLSSQAVKTLLAGARGLMVDECHSVAAQTFYKVLMRCPAYYRIGFSGTPLDRGDRRNVYVVASTGPKLYTIEAQLLIDQGVLSRPTIHMVPCRQALPNGAGWQEVYRRGIVESDQRNALVCAVANSRPGPTLVFVKEIEHGRRIERAMQRRGLKRCEFVWGQDSSRERRAAIVKLQRGDVDVLITSSIFEMGIDIPEVRCVVVASAGKSTIRTLQRLGRGMRVHEGKSTMELWDLDDQGHRWLDQHSGKRIQAYGRDGYRILQIPADQANMLVRQFG